MSTLARIFAAAMCLALAGCYVPGSDATLVTDDMAVAPYERISFRSDTDEDPNIAMREGKAYVLTSDEGIRMEMRFMPVEGNLYIVETYAHGKNEDGEEETMRLFGGLVLDASAGKAMAYNVMGNPGNLRPGLRECPDGTVCIDDIKAYVGLVKETVASGADPDTTYLITLD